MQKYSLMNAPNAITTYPHARLQDWTPQFAPGRIDRLYLHWSAGNYTDVFPAYHFCVALDESGSVTVVQTNRIEANMREVRENPDSPYAAHTRGRNSYALGLSIMSMRAATPGDFGAYPLTPPLIDGLCAVAAELASFYDIAVDASHVMTHAEAAVADGYFGAGENERWDIARLSASAQPLEPAQATQVGNVLRTGILTAKPRAHHTGP
ncbi:MAG: hypothetical protein M3126_01510 [Candidatus Eremiobacteraeota bacterium]|nr:hypothetical protein [Candidatus Eremiobacteraeota bacterium]